MSQIIRNLFNPSNNFLTGAAEDPADPTKTIPMKRARWYGSPTTLPDGRIYIQGGSGGGDLPEIREFDGRFSLLGGASTSSLFNGYPRNFIAPDGRIFGFSDPWGVQRRPRLHHVLRGLETGQPHGSRKDAVGRPERLDLRPGHVRARQNSTHRRRFQCPPRAGRPHTSAKNAAAVININGPTPTYKKQPNMPVSLHWATATVLADGNVVVTGGSQQENQLVGANTRALLWKADTGNWVQGPVGSGRARLYHSVALLLPDGSVLVGGGGAPGPETNLNVEFYFPYYLFNSSAISRPGRRLRGSPRTASPGARNSR